MKFPIALIAALVPLAAFCADQGPDRDEYVIHAYDVRPLLGVGKNGADPDPEARDVNVRGFINLLKDAAGTEKDWAAGEASIRDINGLLYVKQREEMHARIRKTLQGLMNELGAVKAAEPLPVKKTTAPGDWALHVYDARVLTETIPDMDRHFTSITGTLNYGYKDVPREEIISLIKGATGAENWVESASVYEMRGRLYVYQREAIHERIRQLFADAEKDKKKQIFVQVRILKLDDSPSKPYFTPQEFSDLAAKAGADAELHRVQLLCYSGQSAIMYGGREITYIESFIANTEGGGNIGGAREAGGSPLPAGLSLIVKPTSVGDAGNIELTFRVNLMTNIAFRPLAKTEKLAMQLTKIPVEKVGDKVDDHSDVFSPPDRDAARLLTQVQVPKGKWALAGTLAMPSDNKKPLYVFTTAEAVEP